MRSAEARQHDSARQYVGHDVGETGLSTAVSLAAEALDYPIGMVNVMDSVLLHPVTTHGLDLPEVTPRSLAVCEQVLLTGGPVVVADLREHYGDDYHEGWPLSYVGVPLTGREGLVVGSLCLMDTVPRRATPEEIARLGRYGELVSDQLELLRGDVRNGSTRDLDTQGFTTTDLQAALDRGEIVPWYQPVVDLGTGEVTGVEALARWQHPELGLLPPSAFLPLAERSEFVIDLDLAVLQAALADVRRWHGAGKRLRLNVNLSGRHFAHDACVERMDDALRGSGVSPRDVSLELTESSFVAADAHDVGFVDQLREIGFQMWLDDFGTGWSTLRHVLLLPADGLKIDRGVTSALGTPKGDAVVKAVAALAADTGLGVVVEGVESEAQRDRAAELGCATGQGYLWSKPAPADEIAL